MPRVLEMSARKINDSTVIKMLKGGANIHEVAKAFSTSRSLIYAVMRRNSSNPAILKSPSPAHFKKIRTTHTRTKHEPTEDQYVQRDPCFCCGSRGDYDCGHGR